MGSQVAWEGVLAGCELLARVEPSSPHTMAPHPSAPQVQLLNAIDAVCSHPELLIEHYVPVLSHLLPALSAAGERLRRVHAVVSLQVEAPLVHCKRAQLQYQSRNQSRTQCLLAVLYTHEAGAGTDVPRRCFLPPLPALQWPASGRRRTPASAASSCSAMWCCRQVATLERWQVVRGS